MGQDAKRAAEKLINEKSEALITTIKEHEDLKLREIRFDTAESLGYSKAKKAHDDAWTKANAAKAALEKIVEDTDRQIKDQSKKVREQAQALRESVRERVLKLREEIWMGALTPELRAKVMAIPTPAQLKTDGLKVLLTHRKGEIPELEFRRY